MGYSFKIDAEAGLAFLNRWGDVDLGEFLTGLNELIDDPDFPRVIGIVNDVTRARIVASAEEMVRLSDYVDQRLGGQIRRIAIITSVKATFGMARMFEMMVDGRPSRIEIRVVNTLEDALEWIAD